MKKLMTKGSLIVAAGCILIGFVGCGKTANKINFEDYANVTFSGANEYGRAMASLDTGAIESELFGDESDSDDLSGLSDIFKFDDAINIEVTPKEGLSNGDTVTLKVDVDESVMKELGLKNCVEDTEIQYKVDGLTDVETADIFSYVKVEYTGVAPYAKPIISNTATEMPFSSIAFTCDDGLQLDNGSTFTITAKADSELLLQYGYELTKDTYEYTAENVPSYVSKFEDISQPVIDELKQEGAEAIKQAWKTQEGIVSYSDPEYCGAYFYIKKEFDNDIFTNKNNMVFFVYKANATTDDGTMEVYAATEYVNLVNGNADVTVYEKKPMSWLYTSGDTTIASVPFMSYSVFISADSIPSYAEDIGDYAEEKVGL